jgi:hypothetical protein
MDKFHDSAGVPWEGRQFETNPFASDDGSTPAVVAKALSADLFSLAILHQSLMESRLLIPLVAQLGDSEVGAHGQLVDKSAELSIVAVATPDGQSAIPAFTSVSHMQFWKADARPVPIEASRVALAAIAEGHNRVVLNPGSDSIGLRRPFLAALAQKRTWIPPSQNPEISEFVAQASARLAEIMKFSLTEADPRGSLQQPELTIELRIRSGLNAQELNDLLQKFSADLQSERFLALVDSISLKVLAS